MTTRRELWRLRAAFQDYLYELDKALRELGPESRDDHVHDLSRRCRELEANEIAGIEERQSAGMVDR